MHRLTRIFQKGEEVDTPPLDAFEMATDQERRKGFLRYLNRGWLCFGMITLIFLPFFPEERLLYITIVSATFPTYIVVRVLNLRGKTWLAGLIFSLFVNLTIFALFMIQVQKLGAYEAFQTQISVWMMMGLAIAFAGSVLNKWAAVGFALFDTILLVGTRLALAPESFRRPGVVVFLWLAALTVWLYEGTLNQALTRLRAAHGRLEELVRVRTQSLEETVEELERAKTLLEAANTELEAFSYSVSHDLRTPLRAIEGFSRILVEQSPTSLEEGKRYLQLISENARRMSQLIDDLLTFSRLGRRPLRKQTVDLVSLTRELLDEMQSEYAGRQIDLSIGTLPACEADPSLLRQVFANLLGNAIKYSRTRELARIQVGWQEQQGETIYFVRDNGVGFDMQYADKLFGVFQRLHRQDEFEGTGVGLATVQRILHRHGGRIWAEAEVDKGATFYFTI